MQSQQFRYKKLIQKVRVVSINDESFVLLSDIEDAFQRPMNRFTVNGEPIGFALDEQCRRLEPFRIPVTSNSNDIIDCQKDLTSKYSSLRKGEENGDILAEMKHVQDKLNGIDTITQKILENTDALIKKADAIIRQTRELAEYTIPRLFIILPESKTPVDSVNWWTKSYRLYFICECETERHLAFHKGYKVKQPRQFFRKYGPYLKNMLTVVRAAIAVSSFALPQIESLDIYINQLPVFLFDRDFQQNLNKSIKEMDHVVENALIEYMSPGTANTVDREGVVEGVELREIQSFLKNKDELGRFGNLYRSTNENGQVQWLCFYHYRQASSAKQLDILRQEFRQLGGELRLGTAIVEKSSAKKLEEMLDIISRGLSLVKLTLKACKIRMTTFEKLLFVASQRNLIHHIEFQDVIVSPAVGFPKTHNEIIPKLEEAINNSKQLTIQYTVSLHRETLEKNTLLSYFTMHSSPRLSLHLFANDIIERFSCSGLSNSDLETIREWIRKTESSWSIRTDDGDRYVFIHAVVGLKQSLLTLIHLLLRSPSLRELTFHQTIVNEDVLQMLCEALGNDKTSLEVLNFQENIDLRRKSAVMSLVSMLTNKNALPMKFESSSVPHIVGMLKGNTTLTEISLLSISSLHANDIMLVAEAIGMHPRLSVVKIGCLPSSSLGHAYKVFDHVLKSTTIEDLTCTVDGDEQFYELRNALEKNKILKRLHISVFNLNRTEINDGFCQYVARLPLLKTFSLSFDTTIDSSRLIRCLTTNSSLQSLSLTRVSNWQQVTSLIEGGPKLRSLSLCQCDIPFRDIEVLVNSLKSNPESIIELNLSNNNLSDDSATKLGSALLSESFPLTMLDLSNNSLSLPCLVCLIKMLHFNTMLKVLDIRECLKRGDQETYIPAEVQECKKAIADLTAANEFVEVRWID